MLDTKENCWKFFIDRVQRYLKCVLCFSPVGATLRKRARQFPALVNCTSINWFQDWPQDALESVSTRFLEVKLSLNLFYPFYRKWRNYVRDLSKPRIYQKFYKKSIQGISLGRKKHSSLQKMFKDSFFNVHFIIEKL